MISKESLAEDYADANPENWKDKYIAFLAGYNACYKEFFGTEDMKEEVETE